MQDIVVLIERSEGELERERTLNSAPPCERERPKRRKDESG